MKFPELPEGFYQITEINNSTNTVYVEAFENPGGIPLVLFIPEPIEVIHDGRSYSHRGGFLTPQHLDDMDVKYKTFAEVQKERKARSTRYGHVKRRLNAGEPLVGSSLKLALSLIGNGDTGHEFNDGIAKKLIAGQPLGEYEHHIFVDVILLRSRLA